MSAADLFKLTDVISPWAVRVAATLRLADRIAAGVCGLDALAKDAGCNADALGRLLRYLVTRGVFEEVEPGRFALNEAARPLEDGHPLRLRAWLDLEGMGGRMDRTFADLLQAIRSGEPAYPGMYGRPFWEDLAADPALAASFDSLMATSDTWFGEVARGYDWSEARHVIDVGGGKGALLATLLRAHPHLRGTVVDLPSAEKGAVEFLAAEGLADRSEFVARSFFEPLPPGADVYVLSKVIHDWSDRDAARILGRCAEAAGETGRVLIVDGLLAEDESRAQVTQMDLRMLVLVGGRERTLEDFRALGRQAGLEIASTRQLPMGQVLLECAR